MFGSLSTKIAHATPSLGNQDLRFLQESINKEKEIVTSMQKVSKDLGVAAEAMKMWGAGEGEDISDVTNVALSLLMHIGSAANVFADHELAIRGHLKEIRTKEEQLDELRRRRKTVGGKLEAQERKLSKMGSENKQLSLATEQLAALQNEIRQLDTSILVDMARLSDHKRRLTRSILILKFGGMAELGEKLTIIGELGKLLAAEVPQDVTPPGQGRAPYMGREATQKLLVEAGRCIGGVTFNPNSDEQFTSRTPNMRSQILSGMEQVPPGAASNISLGPDARSEGSGLRDPRLTLGQPIQHRGQSSVSSLGGGTMPALNGPPRGPPVDEFGRPIDGLPIQANTMPAMGGSGPIQQAPLSDIQHSMRSPDAPPGGGPAPFGGYGPSGTPTAGPPRAPLNQQQQQHRPSQFSQPSGSQFPPQQQQQQRPPMGSQYAQPSSQRKPAPALERGLTLSLPLRSRQQSEETKDEGETDSPFVPPASNAPSAFKQPPPARQNTTDSDVVLAEGETDLHRVTTLPPKVGIDDFPAWSLGLGDMGLGDDGKGAQQKPEEPEPKEEAAVPAKEPTAATINKTTTSTISQSSQPGTDSANQTPITETPTTYTDTPTKFTPTIRHDHVVDNPETRSTGNSGRFAQFPDRRGLTSNDSEGLLPPQSKFASRPGMNRTPSPYPNADDASPVPTPIPTPGEDILPINPGSTLPPEASETSLPAPRSILLDSSQSRAGTQSTFQNYSGTPVESASSLPRLRFAPRPPSPVTPSPVTTTNGAWASKESFESGGNAGGSGFRPEPEQKPSGRPEGNRLSVITPLGINKNKDGGSQPSTPKHEYFPTETDISEDQLKAMIDSFAAQVGSPDSSSNPPSGVESGNISLDNSNPNQSGANRRYFSTTDSSMVSHASEPSDSSALLHYPPRGTTQDSSLDTTAATAGSPFPSPIPPAVAPSNPRVGAGIMDRPSNMAGVGSRYAHGRSDSGESDESGGTGRITAAAFKRHKDVGSSERGGHPASPATGRIARGTDAPPEPMSSAPQRQSYQMPQVFDRSGASSPHSDYRSEHSSAYHAAQPPPQIIAEERSGLPPGAAAPSRYGAGTDPNQLGNDPRWAGAGGPPVQEYAERSRSPVIPSSLIPGRPGSAAPLAPIGHVGRAPISPVHSVNSVHSSHSVRSSGSIYDYMTGGGGDSRHDMGPQVQYQQQQVPRPQPANYPPQNRGNISPPWKQQPPQQQQQYQQQNLNAPQQNMRAHSPLTGDFDGSALLQDAYGGMDSSPYSAANPRSGFSGYGGRG